MRDKSLVVIQLTGGNDYLNTVVPYTNGLYYDSRQTVNIPADQVLPINDRVGFNPNMTEIKELWDEGKVAVINGIGYFNPNHFANVNSFTLAKLSDLPSPAMTDRRS